MLYPDFQELIALKRKARGLQSVSKRKVAATHTGVARSSIRGQGLEFEEVRQYAHGDDIRSIDWRVTARTGVAHTKVFVEERQRSVLVCVDVNAYMRFGTKSTFKSVQAAKVASLLGWQAHQAQSHVGACLYGDLSRSIEWFSPKRSHMSIVQMAKALSLPVDNVTTPTKISLAETLRYLLQVTPMGALVYLVSDFHDLRSSDRQLLSSLHKRAQVVLIAIDDPADYALVPIGGLYLQSVAQRSPFYIQTNQRKGRKKYLQQWQDKRFELHAIARQIGAHVMKVSTEDDAYKQLAYGLRSIHRHKGRS